MPSGFAKILYGFTNFKIIPTPSFYELKTKKSSETFCQNLPKFCDKELIFLTNFRNNAREINMYVQIHVFRHELEIVVLYG